MSVRLAHAIDDPLDRDLAAILALDGGSLAKRNRRGLLLALPLALIIGAITVGLAQDEGSLPASDRVAGSALSDAASDAGASTASDDMQPIAPPVPVPPPAPVASVASPAARDVDRPAPSARHPTRAHRRSTEFATRDRDERARASAPPPQYNPIDQERTTRDAQEEQRRLAAQRSRLAAIDALRDLRLK